MAYGETKVYFDGSHYIAIPHTERPKKPRAAKQEKEILLNEKMEVIEEEFEEVPSVITLSSGAVLEEVEFVDGELKPVVNKVKKKGTRITKKQLFEDLYKQYQWLKKGERRKKIIEGLKGCFKKLEDTERYIDANLERKQRNLIQRRIRLTRKANMQEFNYFCTFTYDDKKHDELSFRKKIKKTLENFRTRKGWKYIAVWERGKDTNRLHMHAITYIPEDGMVGELIEKKDYSFEKHDRTVTKQNTYFNERFGRSDFELLGDKNSKMEALAYIMKYLEKSGEKIIYSRGLPQYFISDIMDEDIVCPIGQDDQKLLLFDDFTCWDEGTYMGTVSKETIGAMRKSN